MRSSPDRGHPGSPEQYDCAIITALAITASKSTEPTVYKDSIAAVTKGDVECTTDGDCVEKLKAGKTIAYVGPGGPTRLNSVGDTTVAQFQIYVVDDKGQSQPTRSCRWGIHEAGGKFDAIAVAWVIVDQPSRWSLESTFTPLVIQRTPARNLLLIGTASARGQSPSPSARWSVGDGHLADFIGRQGGACRRREDHLDGA